MTSRVMRSGWRKKWGPPRPSGVGPLNGGRVPLPGRFAGCPGAELIPTESSCSVVPSEVSPASKGVSQRSGFPTRSKECAPRPRA
jgi:hypothetical protein